MSEANDINGSYSIGHSEQKTCRKEMKTNGHYSIDHSEQPGLLGYDIVEDVSDLRPAT